MSIDDAAGSASTRASHGHLMPRPPDKPNSLAVADASAQIDERDLKPGERRRGGQSVVDEKDQ